MKAQINAEFLVSIVVIATVLMFVLVSISNTLPRFKSFSRDVQRDMKALVLSQLFLLDKKLGFSKSYYELNETKIKEFSEDCRDYENIRKIYGYIAITISDFDGTTYLDCKPPVASILTSVVKRYATLNGKIVELKVEVFE